MEKNT